MFSAWKFKPVKQLFYDTSENTKGLSANMNTNHVLIMKVRYLKVGNPRMHK